MSDTVFVRTTSNRSRARLASLLGSKPTYYYSWDRVGINWAEIPAAMLPGACAIPGVTKARLHGIELLKCWSFD